ncbi:cation diffusion facilitator family transporter [Thermoplasmatales archaeon BRNA1]|nr:cation diffusion facilitator family transporter [Thermoplasmatales archaeon BRNA1]
MAEEKVSAARRNFNFQKVIAAVGTVLMLGKFFAYLLTGSVAILTDALESIVNVVAGCIGLYALWLSMQPADRSHPYGHGKVELISSSVEGTMIVIAGLLIIYESVMRLLNPEDIRELDVGIVIVALAAIANFAMGATAIRMGKKSNSIALEASGRHLCTDTYSSVGIIIGLTIVLAADWAGYDCAWIDPIMALMFGAFIVVTGVRVIYRSFNGIMDGADRIILREVIRCLNKVRTPEIIDVHHLRVVRYGTAVHIDAHMVVPQDLSIEQVWNLQVTMSDTIMRMIGENVDITFQAESCEEKSCAHCPKENCGKRAEDFVRIVFIGEEEATDNFPASWQSWQERHRKH